MRRRVWLAIVVLGLGGLTGSVVRQRLHRTRWVTTYALAQRTIEENASEGRRAGLRPVQVGGQRGLLRPPSSGHDWFLYWGGNTASYFKEAVDVVAALELPPEVGVLIVAPPGYDSEGRPSPEIIEAEAVNAREWLRAQQGAQRIVLGSYSMGCFSVFAAAEAHVVGAVLVGVSEELQFGTPGPFIRLATPEVFARKPEAPVVSALVIQGDLDWPPEEPEVVAAWLNARRLMVPGATHEDSRLHPTVIHEMRDFVLAALSSP